MTVSAPLVNTSGLTALTLSHRFVRALVRRPSLLVLMALYVFAASCATSAPGVLVGLAVVAVFALKTCAIVRAELRLTA
jgi:hypothetical protein